MTNKTTRPVLSDLDRRAIAKARELAGAHGIDAIREVTGTKSEDIALVYGEAFGAAQVRLFALTAIVERLAGDRPQTCQTCGHTVDGRSPHPPECADCPEGYCEETTAQS